MLNNVFVCCILGKCTFLFNFDKQKHISLNNSAFSNMHYCYWAGLPKYMCNEVPVYWHCVVCCLKLKRAAALSWSPSNSSLKRAEPRLPIFTGLFVMPVIYVHVHVLALVAIRKCSLEKCLYNTLPVSYTRRYSPLHRLLLALEFGQKCSKIGNGYFVFQGRPWVSSGPIYAMVTRLSKVCKG